MSAGVRVFPLEGIPEVEEGDDLALFLAEAAGRAGGLEDADVVVVAQKIVSKAEGRVVRLDGIEPSERALEIAGDLTRATSRRFCSESVQVVRVRPPLMITETRHGFICASAGVDASNAKGEGTLILLPLDPDASAARDPRRLARAHRLRRRRDRQRLVRPAVPPGDDRRRARGRPASRRCSICAASRDSVGYELQATQIAVADELAGAAELVFGKTNGSPGGGHPGSRRSRARYRP